MVSDYSKSICCQDCVGVYIIPHGVFSNLFLCVKRFKWSLTTQAGVSLMSKPKFSVQCLVFLKCLSLCLMSKSLVKAM